MCLTEASVDIVINWSAQDFFSSILALIYAIAALIFVVHCMKREKQSSGKREELP